MRLGPPLFSSSFVLSMGCVVGLGCFLDASAYDTGGAGGTTTTTTNPVGGGGTTTTPTGGTAGTGGTTTTPTTGGTGGSTGGTTTTDTTGGTGGTGGTTTTTGGTGGTGGSPTPTSCSDAKAKGMIASGTVEIDPDGDMGNGPFTVYCDQVNDDGGWALVFNSVGDPGGMTNAFWNIPYAQRLDEKGAPPSVLTNYYYGELYKLGKQYRDDLVDVVDVETLGIMRGTANGINDVTMTLVTPAQAVGNLDAQIYVAQFASGWSAPDFDGDIDPANCATTFANVTQHYAGCWKYSLGAAQDGPGFLDNGWGPHVNNTIVDGMNAILLGLGKPIITKDGMASGSTRVKRITRFTKW